MIDMSERYSPPPPRYSMFGEYRYLLFTRSLQGKTMLKVCMLPSGRIIIVYLGWCGCDSVVLGRVQNSVLCLGLTGGVV